MDSITYTLEQIARILGITKQTLRRRILDGRLAADKATGAYRVTPEALRQWLVGEGYSDPDRILRECRQVAATTPEGRDHPAYVMGRVYALLVQVGAESLEHLAVAATAPGRTFAPLLSKAARLPGYAGIADHLGALVRHLSPADITDKAWDMDRQGRFWLGYYAERGLAAPDDAAVQE